MAKFDVLDQYGGKIGELRESSNPIGGFIGLVLLLTVGVFILAFFALVWWLRMCVRVPVIALPLTAVSAVGLFILIGHVTAPPSDHTFKNGQSVVVTGEGAELRSSPPWDRATHVVARVPAGSSFIVVGQPELELNSSGHILSTWWRVRNTTTGQMGEINERYLRGLSALKGS